MVGQSEARESVEILVFICLPLFILWVIFVVALVRRPGWLARFPGFSVERLSLGHGGADYIAYREEGKLLEFAQWPDPRRWSLLACLLTWPEPKKEVVLTAPQKLSDEEVLRIAPNLVRGLAKLGFHKYKTYRHGSKSILISGETKGYENAAS